MNGPTQHQGHGSFFSSGATPHADISPSLVALPSPWDGGRTSPRGPGAAERRSPRTGLGALLLPRLPRGAAAHSCVGGDFPPLPKGPGPRLQIKWKWGIQRLRGPAAEGKTRRSCSLPPSLSRPYPPRLPSDTRPGDPPSPPDSPLVLPGRQGGSSKVRGRGVTQGGDAGDTESQFQLPVPSIAAGSRLG